MHGSSVLQILHIRFSGTFLLCSACKEGQTMSNVTRLMCLCDCNMVRLCLTLRFKHNFVTTLKNLKDKRR